MPQHADPNPSESCRGLIKSRVAMGFLVIDSSGPAAAESAFAASLMRQLHHPIRLLVADVAVEDHHEIAQDSSCMLAHSQGTFSRVVVGSTLQVPQSV